MRCGMPSPTRSRRRNRKTRIVLVSDSHGQTPKLPQGDVLIHAGDLTNQGTYSELSRTIQWLERADFEAKVVVRLTSPHGPQTSFKVFGSPLSPSSGLWAFGYRRDADTDVWDGIPQDIDILVTHAPPYGHCDTSATGVADGCEALRRALCRVRPKLAVCGHRHEGRGIERIRWAMVSPDNEYIEEKCDVWVDPGVGNKKMSHLDLTAKSGNPLDNSDIDATSATPGHSFSAPSASSTHAAAFDLDTSQAAASEAHWWRSDAHHGRCNAMLRGVSGTPGAAGALPEAEESLSVLPTREANGAMGRMGRRETCIVNAAIMARSYGGPKRFNKPIVVDLDLPVWTDESAGS